MVRSGCGRSCGIRSSTGRQTSTAATPLRIPPSAACVGQKKSSPGSGRRNRRNSRRRAALLLPMPQSKSLLLSREKIPLLPFRSRRPLRSMDGSRHVRTPRKRPPRSRQKISISAHRQRHRSQWQRNRSGRGSRRSFKSRVAKRPASRRSAGGQSGGSSAKMICVVIRCIRKVSSQPAGAESKSAAASSSQRSTNSPNRKRQITLRGSRQKRVRAANLLCCPLNRPCTHPPSMRLRPAHTLPEKRPCRWPSGSR